MEDKEYEKLTIEDLPEFAKQMFNRMATVRSDLTDRELLIDVVKRAHSTRFGEKATARIEKFYTEEQDCKP